MRIVCILTHGQGDMYPVLSILPAEMKARGIEHVKIYVDTVYNSDKQRFKFQLDGVQTMIERITKDWEAVPYEFSGSDSWNDLPESDRRTGPIYEKIKNTFLFYRLERLRGYILSKLQPDDVVIYGPSVWCYEWKDGQNIPIDMSPGRWSVFKPDVSEESKTRLIYATKCDSIIIQARQKALSDNHKMFEELGRYCLSINKRPVYIGSKEEMPAFNVKSSIDFRGELSFDECMFLVENAEHAILTGSGIGCHRLFSYKPTVFMLPMAWGEPGYVFPSNYADVNYKYVDCNPDMLTNISRIVSSWNASKTN